MKKFNILCRTKKEFNDTQKVLLKSGYIWTDSKPNEIFDLFHYNTKPLFPVVINCGFNEDGYLTFDDDYENSLYGQDSYFYKENEKIEAKHFLRKEKLVKINIKESNHVENIWKKRI